MHSHSFLHRFSICTGCAAVLLALNSIALGQFFKAREPGSSTDPSAASPFAQAGAQDESPVEIHSSFTEPAANQPAQLSVTATIKAGWHIYSITQAPGGPIATKITPAESSAYRVTGEFKPDTPPAKKAEPAFDNLVIETHTGKVTWTAPIEFVSGTDLATLKIKGKIRLQPCDENSCLPPREMDIEAGLQKAAPPRQSIAPPAASQPIGGDSPKPDIEKPKPAGSIASTPAPVANGSAVASNDHLPWQPFTTVEALGQRLGPEFELAAVQPIEREQLNLPLGILAGFMGGLLLNIMPCVLPVIGLKVLSFIEQSGHDRRKALTLNLWYSLGLIAVFALLAGLAVSPQHLGWGQLFGKTWFSIGLAAVVFTMGLSFLGVWEIPIPGFAGRGKATELASREGAAGAFSKGVLTTFLATPCSAPFLAPALVWAAAQPPVMSFAVFLSAGVGMASPYLMIGLFPATLRFLPRPGAWMDTFKQTMGFVLFGTVVFILSFLEAPDVVPTVGLLFGLWAACWWIGRISPIAEPAAKARGWVFAGLFATLVWIVMFPGVKISRSNVELPSLSDIMQARVAMAAKPEDSTSAVPTQIPKANEKPKTVLIDFTADWCLSCKVNEAAELNTTAVREAVRKDNVVTLKADWTHERQAVEVTKMLDALKSKQVPVIAIFSPADPNHPQVFRGGYTQGMILEALAKAGPSR